jgi:hypothetical protein
MQENRIGDTLSNAKWLLIIGGICIIIFPYVLTMPSFVKGSNFTETGQIGDTIGGITAPFLNLVAAGLVFLALKAQVQANGLIQSQIDDQRKQQYVDSVNDAIKTQISRVDESIRSISFDLNSYSGKNITGYAGLFEFNEAISVKLGIVELIPADEGQALRKIVLDNITQLTEMYDRVSAAIVIIDNLLDTEALDQKQKKSLHDLLLLNLGESFKINLEKMSCYMKWHSEKAHELDVIYSYEPQISRLRQLVMVVQTFFDNTSI